MRRRIGESEKARIRRHPRIKADRRIEHRHDAEDAYKVINYLTGSGGFRVQAEMLRLLIIRHMVINIK